jgi:hypothetical protein
MAAFYRALDHALLAVVVQLIFAGLGAWLFSEAWQRRRQLRAFQAKALGHFSLFSARLMLDQSELLVSRGKLSAARRHRLARQSLRNRTALLALDVEVFGFFNDDVYGELIYLKNLSRELHRMAFANPPVPQGVSSRYRIAIPLSDESLPRKCCVAWDSSTIRAVKPYFLSVSQRLAPVPPPSVLQRERIHDGRHLRPQEHRADWRRRRGEERHAPD